MKKLFLAGSIFCLILGQNTISPAISLGDEPTQPNLTENYPKVSRVTLLDAGFEPRQQLRFTPVVGTKQTVKIKFTMNTTVTGDPQTSSNTSIFTTEVTIDTTIKKIEPNGYIHLSYLISGATASTPNSDESDPGISFLTEQIIGSGASTIIDSQGNVKKTYDYIFPKKMPSEMREVIMNELLNPFNLIVSPLPTEAVGVGARWKVAQIRPTLYIFTNANQPIIYELKEQQGKILNLLMTVELKTDTQEIKSSSNGSVTMVQTTSNNTQGGGKVTLDLSQIIPLNSTAFLETTTSMKLKSPDASQAMITNYTQFLRMMIQSQ